MLCMLEGVTHQPIPLEYSIDILPVACYNVISSFKSKIQLQKFPGHWLELTDLA